MNRLYYIACTCILILSVWGCSSNQKPADNVLARVGSVMLTQEQLDADMPEGLSDSTRVAFTDKYVDSWITSQLVYNVARKNLPDTKHLDEMVEAYRRDLFSHEYRTRLSNERLSDDIPEDTLVKFYEEHKQDFLLHKPIISGLLLKVPYNTPQLSNIRKWVKSADDQAIEKIEKYAIKNAIGYDYFFDKWVWFDDIKDNIPYDFDNDDTFLKKNKVLECRNEDIIYLLHVDKYLNTGDVMPYEFARKRIIEILLNEYRINFNRELEQELYEEALHQGMVEKFYNSDNDSINVE